MDRIKKKTLRRGRIRQGIRKRIIGTQERPRLTVYRSNSEIYAQVINDEVGQTIIAASSKQIESSEKLTPTEKARQVGKFVAEKAKSENISNVVFDRNGYLYHGRVKALAEGAREEGLNF